MKEVHVNIECQDIKNPWTMEQLKSEAIRIAVMPITLLICTTIELISSVIGKTVVPIACAIGTTVVRDCLPTFLMHLLYFSVSFNIYVTLCVI